MYSIMPSRKVTMRASMSNQITHFGIMGGLYNRKISGRSSMNRVTSRLEIPASAKEGYQYMKMHNLLSRNPLGSGGVGRMFTVRPRGSGLGSVKKTTESSEESSEESLGENLGENLGDNLGENLGDNLGDSHPSAPLASNLCSSLGRVTSLGGSWAVGSDEYCPSGCLGDGWTCRGGSDCYCESNACYDASNTQPCMLPDLFRCESYYGINQCHRDYTSSLTKEECERACGFTDNHCRTLNAERGGVWTVGQGEPSPSTGHNGDGWTCPEDPSLSCKCNNNACYDTSDTQQCLLPDLWSCESYYGINQCHRDLSSNTSKAECERACVSITGFECTDGACVFGGGTLTADECESMCHPPSLYQCMDNTCSPASTGVSKEKCERNCGS
jgi:hypothetical protein